MSGPAPAVFQVSPEASEDLGLTDLGVGLHTVSPNLDHVTGALERADADRDAAAEREERRADIGARSAAIEGARV
jgi:hypothetical protein